MTVVVFVKLPLVPFTVMVLVPVLALELTVNLRLDVPLPVMEAGVKVAVTPDGKVLVDNVTADPNPPETVLVILVLPELPLRTLSEVGEALRVKLPVTGAVTVRLTLVELTLSPVFASVPVMEIGYVPVVVPAATLKLATDVPVPGEAMEVGTKVTVTPLGWPE